MRSAVVVLISVWMCGCAAPLIPRTDVTTSRKLDAIFTTEVIPTQLEHAGQRMKAISAAFLGTPYQANTLKGSLVTPESLVVNFSGVDCMTLVEYVYALGHSQDRRDFVHQLINTRYRNGVIGYTSRKHFLSDWVAVIPKNAVDITETLSPHCKTVHKYLNQRAEGGVYLPGINVVERNIHYLPASYLNVSVLDALKDGDIVGVYTPQSGLDVSHVGIVIRKGPDVLFRNASSLVKNRKVVDTPLLSYMTSRPGIMWYCAPLKGRAVRL